VVAQVTEEQNGFMPDKGTRNAIFLLRILAERSIQMQKDVYICFLDYVKAFDKVQHKILIEMLELLDIDGKEIDLIADLYWGQQACVSIDETFSDWFTVEIGLCQGCNLSLDPFARHADRIMRVVKELGYKHQ